MIQMTSQILLFQHDKMTSCLDMTTNFDAAEIIERKVISSLILMLTKLIMKYNICTMFTCVLLIAFCLLADVDASDSELLKKLRRSSRSTVTIIRHKVGHPEPIVVEDDRWASFDFNIGPRLDMDFYGGGNALAGSSPLSIQKPYFWGGAIDGRIGWAKRSSLTVIKLTDKESLPDIVVENRRAALEFNYGHKIGAESFGYGSVVKIHENEFSPHVLNQWSGSLEGSVGWGHGINFGAYLKPAIIQLGYDDESERDLGDHESFPIGISS
ncbi:hypothetical protein T4C_11994 [Trichinella pseudospiralis]|uniref:Uncharacterized protein n=1 Tax=Trichinella pseudospiralis TaxID=6337 RepID=A0A0V1K8Y7_TRIPS|nr:hypothetical protein T4C_11994 [Trichinella pseudospiralis]